MRDHLFHDGAVYCPAIQNGVAAIFGGTQSPIRTHKKLNRQDGNFLSPHGLFTVSDFLIAAPNLLNGTPAMVTERDRSLVRALIDSGGYQVSTGLLPFTDEMRLKLFQRSQQFEHALILDAPTSAIGRAGTGFYSFDQCLAFTLSNAHFAIANCEPGGTEFLNVIQGRSLREANAWYQAVASLNNRTLYGDRALRGVAFAGATRLHFSIVLPILLRFLHAGLLNSTDRFHFLGTSHPEVACALTAIQDGLRDALGPGVAVSFDSATPFLLAGRYKRAYGTPSLTTKELIVPVGGMPQGDEFLGSDQPWPCTSPIADRLTLGDLNIRPGDVPWDSISDAWLAAHNVWTMSHAIAVAVGRLRMPTSSAQSWLPWRIIELSEIIREVFRSEFPMTLINKCAPELDQLAHKSRNTTLSDVFYEDDR